jgi:hypothetical protein
MCCNDEREVVAVVRVRRGGPVEEKSNVRSYYGEVYVAVLSRGG